MRPARVSRLKPATIEVVTTTPRSKPHRSRRKPFVVRVPKATTPKRRNKGLPGSSKLMKRRLSVDGRNFLYKYINPCHNDGLHCSGVPLAVPEETAIVSSRVDQTISAPSPLISLWGGAATNNDWYLGIFVPPWIDDCVFLFASAVQIVEFEALSSLVSGANEYPGWIATTPSPTLQNGIWYCKITSPMVETVEQATAAAHQDFSNFRLIGRGVTTQLIADALTNRGEVTASQWNAPMSPINVVTTGTIDNQSVITSSEAGHAIFFGQVTPKQITATDTQAYQDVARKGCYFPVYMNDDDRPMLPAAYRPLYSTADRNVTGTVDVSKLSVVYRFTIVVTTKNAITNYVVKDVNGVQLHTGSVGHTDLTTFNTTNYTFNDLGVPTGTTAYVSLYQSESGDDPSGPKSDVSFVIGSSILWFRNTNNADGTALAFSTTTTAPTADAGYTLNGESNQLYAPTTINGANQVARKIYVPNQNVGTIWYQGIAGSASVRVKGRMFLEAEAQPGSSWAGFNQPGAVEDEGAMQVAAQVSKRMSHGFPASCNQNGVLSKLLTQLLSKVPVVGDFLSQLI
ncbi:hypothetical protein [Likani virus]|nr:hypothetical protein [Likani virus]